MTAALKSRIRELEAALAAGVEVEGRLLLLLLRIRARKIYISNGSLAIRRVPEVAWKI